MTDQQSLSYLPKADQDELIQLVKAKLLAAKKEADYISSRLVTLEESMRGYKLFLGADYEDEDCKNAFKSFIVFNAFNHDSGKDNSEEPYDPSWTQTAKILYVLRHPERYGENTFVGAGSVVNAIKKEESDLKNEDNSSLLKRFGPALSRLVQNREIVRAVEIDNKTRVHYLSPEWFDNDKPLPQYFNRVSHLEVTHKEQSYLQKKRQLLEQLPNPNQT